LYQFGAGAGIGGGDRYDRGFEFRILSDLGIEKGLHTEQYNQRADHQGQHRALDEIIGQHRGLLTR
jgi:hypothetical protein